MSKLSSFYRHIYWWRKLLGRGEQRGCSVFKVLLKCWCSSRLCVGFHCKWLRDVACGEWTGSKIYAGKVEITKENALKGNQYEVRGQQALLLVCQNVFNGFIGYFSHLRNWHEKGKGPVITFYLSLTKSLFFFLENFTWFHYTHAQGLRLQQNYNDKPSKQIIIF